MERVNGNSKKLIYYCMEENYQMGIHNRLAKIYFYCNTGLNLVNNFRNLIFAIFAGYYALRLNNILWLLLMFVVSIPILIIVGWYCVHYMNKVTDWLNVKYGTHYSKRNFALIEEQVILMKEIRDLLK